MDETIVASGEALTAKTFPAMVILAVYAFCPELIPFTLEKSNDDWEFPLRVKGNDGLDL